MSSFPAATQNRAPNYEEVKYQIDQFYAPDKPVTNVSTQEIKNWITRQELPKAYYGVNLKGLGQPWLDKLVTLSLQYTISLVFPVDNDNTQSYEVPYSVSAEEIAEELGRGAPAREISDRTETYSGRAKLIGLGASQWMSNMATDEGLKKYKQQAIIILNGNRLYAYVETFREILSLRYYINYQTETYNKTLRVADFFEDEFDMWNCLAMKENGASWLINKIDQIKQMTGCKSDTLFIAHESEIALRNRPENNQFRIAGTSVEGFRNKDTLTSNVTMIDGNALLSIKKIQLNTDQPIDLLREVGVQIGQFQTHRCAYGTEDPDSYNPKDAHVVYYNQDDDKRIEESGIMALDNCGLFGNEGKARHPAQSLSGKGKVYGTGNISDIKKDPFVRDGKGLNEVEPIVLIGENKEYEAEDAVHFASVMVNRVGKAHVGESHRVIEDFRSGMNLLHKYGSSQLTPEWIDQFFRDNVREGNVVDPPADRITGSQNRNLKQLRNTLPTASYKLPKGLPPFGSANLWTLEAMVEQGLITDKKERKTAEAFVSLCGYIASEAITCIPDCSIIHESLTPRAVRIAKKEYSMFVNTVANTTNFIWVNVNHGKNDEGIAELLSFTSPDSTEAIMERAKNDVSASYQASVNIFDQLRTLSSISGASISADLDHLGVSSGLIDVPRLPSAEVNPFNQRYSGGGHNQQNFDGPPPRQTPSPTKKQSAPKAPKKAEKKQSAPKAPKQAAKKKSAPEAEADYEEDGNNDTKKPKNFNTDARITQKYISERILNVPETASISAESLSYILAALRARSISWAYYAAMSNGSDKTPREQIEKCEGAIHDIFNGDFESLNGDVHVLEVISNEKVFTSFSNPFSASRTLLSVIDSFVSVNLRNKDDTHAEILYNLFGVKVSDESDDLVFIATQDDVKVDEEYGGGSELRGNIREDVESHIREHPLSFVSPWLLYTVYDSDNKKAPTSANICKQQDIVSFAQRVMAQFNSSADDTDNRRRAIALVNAMQAAVSTNATHRGLYWDVDAFVNNASSSGVHDCIAPSGFFSSPAEFLSSQRDRFTSESNETVKKMKTISDNIKKSQVALRRDSSEETPIYVQTSLTLTSDAILSLLNFYRSYPEYSAKRVYPMLPTSLNDPERVGTFSDLEEYANLINNPSHMSKVPVNTLNIKEYLYSGISSFYYVSSIMSKRNLDLTSSDHNNRSTTGRNALAMLNGNTGAFGNAGRGMQAKFSGFGSNRNTVDAGRFTAVQLIGSDSILSDLASENVTHEVVRKFNAVGSHSGDWIKLALARVNLLSGFSYTNIRAFLVNGLPTGICWVSAAPWSTYDCQSALKVAAGGKCARIAIGNPLYMVGSSKNRSDMSHQFSCTTMTKMVHPGNAYTARRVHVVGLGGGSGAVPYNPEEQAKTQYLNPQEGKYGTGKESRIIFAVGLKFGKNIPMHFDLTGRFHRLRALGVLIDNDMNNIHYSTAYRTCALWDIRGGPLSSSARKYNTELHAGEAVYWDRHANKFNDNHPSYIPPSDHWGRRGTYPGCRMMRSGKEIVKTSLTI